MSEKKYIDHKKFNSKLNYIIRAYGLSGVISEKIKKAIKESESTDVAEVKYGQNLNRKYIAADEFRCSECGIHLEDWSKCVDEENDVWGEYEFKFCPNCGAKMEGDAN